MLPDYHYDYEGCSRSGKISHEQRDVIKELNEPAEVA
jgi:hypothetical protein